ncbi:DUF882 domain-containing protein [Maritalea mediterranea]|uniref:Murein endopeptidase K n=1 Tax=Maritalea mediterranea TaxID=2909667 RepID=A0ABS9EBU6_9HYPH|nr:DUF882 domain-containing protein [Maritalea mediterranea]MCF4099624.1 DUF882 domain-containing protein [Maritalea mediterranea]
MTEIGIKNVLVKAVMGWSKAVQRLAAAILVAALLAPSLVVPSYAAGDRTLYLYYTHTRETAKITFKRNGRYDKKGLAELNYFLRDWRRNEPTKMDPRLFDLVWEVYQEVGAKKPIHVVSAYRAPKTNAMLRARSSGVAKNSNHTRGLALDFYIPGVPVSKLRQVAMKKHVGGVGYYPSSGSPFVHLDTGSVRAWPRMTTAQLKRIFPDGKTMHIPSNGVLLSKSGYAAAKSEWSRCRQLPCGGNTRVASRSSSDAQDDGNKTTLMDMLFGGDDQEKSTSNSPRQNTVKSQPIRVAALSGLPPARPSSEPETQSPIEFVEAPVSPPKKPVRLAALTAPSPSSGQDEEEAGSRFAIAAANESTVTPPAPRALMTEPGRDPLAPLKVAALGNQTTTDAPQNSNEGGLFTAYAPLPEQTEDAQKALETILARKAEPQKPEPAPQTTAIDKTEDLRKGLAVAALSPNLDEFGAILKNAQKPNTKPSFDPLRYSLTQRRGELVAPDLGHVVEMFTGQTEISAPQYAVMFEPDQADLDPSVVMGNKSQLGFDQDLIQLASFNQFGG